MRGFRKRFLGKRPALFKSGQWHFHQDNTPVHNSILVTDYLTKIGIKTTRHRPYSLDLAPCDFWLFPKLRGCRYETIEMKEVVTKAFATLTQEDFHGAFQTLLERHNKCIAAGGDYFEGDWSFMCLLSIKVRIRKKSGSLFNDPRIYINVLGVKSICLSTKKSLFFILKVIFLTKKLSTTIVLFIILILIQIFPSQIKYKLN